MIEQQLAPPQQWLEQLLDLIGIPAQVRIESHPDSGDVGRESACWLTIDESTLTPAQTDILIGKDGETIDAIQYLANTLLNIDVASLDQRAFTVELNGYRACREAELLRVAEIVARQVRETGLEVEMKSLSSAERRQVHTFFKDSGDLATESRGQEPDRRLVVRLR